MYHIDRLPVLAKQSIMLRKRTSVKNLKVIFKPVLVHVVMMNRGDNGAISVTE